MSYWAEKKRAADVLIAYIEQTSTDIPGTVRKAVETWHVHKRTDRRGILQPGYNCTLPEYFESVREAAAAAGGKLAWSEILAVYGATPEVFERRYFLFCRRYPVAAEKCSLILDTHDREGVLLGTPETRTVESPEI